MNSWSMEPGTVLVKTSRGFEEIRTRALGVSQRIRTLLILIDGRTPVAELIRRLPSLPDAVQVLEALVRGGFVTVKPEAQVIVSEVTTRPMPVVVAEPVAPAAPIAPAAPTAQIASAPLVAPNDDVRHAISELCRILHDNLGPDADVITVRVENSRTRVEFAQAVRRGISLLQAIVGTDEANRFQARAQAILDTYFGR